MIPTWARLVLAFLLVAHGIAHVVGFAVPWRLVSSTDLPYKTTILAGRIDVGDAGIRAIGILWLAVGLAFVVAAGAWMLKARLSLPLTAIVGIVSLLLCLAEWPQARIGAFVNLGLLIAIPFIAASAWRDNSTAIRQRLVARSSATSRVFSSDRLGDLPAPAARYFRRVLRDGQPYVDAADITQEGEFFAGNRWRPFTATQRYTTAPPGFVWDASIRMAPLMPTYVRDAYVDGRASMRGELFGLYTVVNASGAAELDAGALHRYFAEAVWFPSALLPAPNLTWTPVNDRSARATMTDGRTTVSLEFRFTDTGDVAEIFARDRFAETDGHYEQRPWLVRCRQYAQVGGMRIPVECDVEWQLPSGPLPYWRGRVVTAKYSFAK